MNTLQGHWFFSAWAGIWHLVKWHEWVLLRCRPRSRENVPGREGEEICSKSSSEWPESICLNHGKGDRWPPQAAPGQFVSRHKAGEDFVQGHCASSTHLPVPTTRARAGARTAFPCCLIMSLYLTLSRTTAGSVGGMNQGQFLLGQGCGHPLFEGQ